MTAATPMTDPAPVAPVLRPDPLDLLAAEHAVLRAACASLEGLATAERGDPTAARALAAQLRAILPAHTADEETHLFPLLRRRAEPEDEIGNVLDRLATEHAEAGANTALVLALLDRVAGGAGALAAADRAALGTYAAAKLRHLILEAAVLLPLARERLSRADRRALARTMAPRAAQEGRA